MSTSTPHEPDRFIGKVLGKPPNNIYKITGKISKGSFGEVYEAVQVSSNVKVAIKVETSTVRDSSLLEEEKNIVASLSSLVGFPEYKFYGSGDGYRFLVTDLLGSSIQELCDKCQRKLSLKSVLFFAEQMITRLESLHAAGYVHRDIKPQNFLIGRDKNISKVYLIDFGLTARFRDKNTNKQYPFAKSDKCVGTLRYMSRASHKGIRQTPRDDLESLGYVLIFLHRGYLPWQKKYLHRCPEAVLGSINPQILRDVANMKDEDHKKLVYKLKSSFSISQLCHSLPVEFSQYFQYVKSLKWEDQVNYNYLRGLMKSCFYRIGFLNDYSFDWIQQTNCRNFANLSSHWTWSTENVEKPLVQSFFEKRPSLHYYHECNGSMSHIPVISEETIQEEQHSNLKQVSNLTEAISYLPPFSTLLSDSNRNEKIANPMEQRYSLDTTDIPNVSYSSQYKPSYCPLASNLRTSISGRDQMKIDTEVLYQQLNSTSSIHSAPLFHPYMRSRSHSLTYATNSGLRSPTKQISAQCNSNDFLKASSSFGDNSSVIANPGVFIGYTGSNFPIAYAQTNSSDNDFSNRNTSPPRSGCSQSISKSQVSHPETSLSPRRSFSQAFSNIPAQRSTNFPEPMDIIKEPSSSGDGCLIFSNSPQNCSYSPADLLNNVAPNTSETVSPPPQSASAQHSVHCQCSVCKRMRTLFTWRARTEVSGGAY